MNDLPQNWTDCRLGDVVDYGKTRKYEPDNIPGDSWVLELEDIEKGTSRLLDRQTFAQRQSKSTKNGFDAGDVLYGKLRPYLNKVLIADRPGYCTTEILPLKTGSHLDARYLFYWLKHPTFLAYVEAESHGLNMPRLGTDTGRAAPFVFAPRPEQTRISDKLDAVLARVNACRNRLDRIPTILKRFRQSVLAAATSGALTEDWRTENAVVDDWQPVSVQTIAHVGTGSTPLRSNPAYFAAVGTPWITSAATSQTLVTTADEFVTSEAISAHRLKTYPIGTLLVAMYGEGKTRGQVTELGIPATINQACAAVVVDESKANRAYVKLALQANYFEMRELAEGGNQPNLNLSKVKDFPLSLPDLLEQTEIVRRVETIFAFADSLEARYAAARTHVEKLTPSLLAKAFRGELVPQDPNDEPAGMLLERIRTLRIKESAEPKPRVRRVGTSINEVPMLSPDKNASDYLAAILHRSKGRTLDAKALWRQSQLSIPDFYEKLKAEADSGLLREIKTDDRSFLEAV